MGLTRLSPGACCGCNQCACPPCGSFPASQLHLSSSTGLVYPLNFVAYPNCIWTTCLTDAGGNTSHDVTVGCLSGCFYVLRAFYSLAICNVANLISQEGYESTTGCSGAHYNTRWTLTGSTCTPLNITWSAAGGVTWTLTL